MTEILTFLDSFDHHPLAWAPRKYTTVQGTAIAAVAGPYHGNGVEFTGGGAGYWPALTGQYGSAANNPMWVYGAWSAQVRAGTTGWEGAGYVVVLRTCYRSPSGLTIDFPHHELRLYEDGHLEVYRHQSPALPQEWVRIEGSETAAGVAPLGEWFTLEYRTRIRRFTPTGHVHARVNGAEVMTVDGVVTADTELFTEQARYFRFGNLEPNGNGVAVAFDDVCARCDTVATAPLEWWGTHRVAVAFPAGPGLSAEHGLVGAASNWAACADLPATPGTADTSYVTKEAGARPVDLYAFSALPAFDPDGGVHAALWAYARTDDDGGDGFVTLRFRGGSGAGGAVTTLRTVTSSLPHFLCMPFTGPAPEAIAGLQAGWGHPAYTPDTTDEAYEASHLAVELWYRPAASPGRAWAVWWP